MKNTLKKISLIFSLILFTTTSSYSQKEYAKFTSGNGKLSMKSSVVAKPGKTQGNVYMDLNIDGKSSISFKGEKSRMEFLSFVNRTYEKFKEWKVTAEENKVTDLNKDIESASLGDNVAFYYGASWKFSFGKNPVRAIMNVNESSKVSYYLYFGKVTASDNQYMKSDSQLFVMEDSDIESLNNVLSTEVINKFIKAQTSAEDLFN